ncbi:hypothetical protein EHJ07_05590 [Cronobacter muytjensii]|uniref:Uncharacterized protein n=1 Tax=Cronobacter muytjensii TaxID=413501 RepID=A0ABQ6U187_9ENTR|nr:hypothetical protein FZI19_09865 [Cronobacter muytjensii]NCH54643.1 hypothetical protein [Cronobacter muytjensii]NCI15969.1 hypothetical protein [Cronobacter muytjensii]
MTSAPMLHHYPIKHIILTANPVLLNLYAKKFRCPDVLTSIMAMFTLSPDFSPIMPGNDSS